MTDTGASDQPPTTTDSPLLIHAITKNPAWIIVGCVLQFLLMICVFFLGKEDWFEFLWTLPMLFIFIVSPMIAIDVLCAYAIDPKKK